MSATIEVAGETATLSDGVWTCSDAGVQQALNTALKNVRLDVYSPNPEAATARKVAETFGGKLIEHDPATPLKPGRLY